MQTSCNSSMRIAVQDANILIDLEFAGLLDPWLQLGIETHTTDLITQELRDGNHQQAISYIQKGKIIKNVLSFEDLVKVVRIQKAFQPGGASVKDASVLYLSIQKEATLLTGDKALRFQAESVHCEVHGTLWILDKLIEGNLIDRAIAASKLEYLISLKGSKKRFLPEKQSKERISRWRKEG